MKWTLRITKILLLLLLSNVLLAQNAIEVAEKFMRQSAQEKQMSQADVADYQVTNTHVSKRSQVIHTYVQQQYQGIPIFDAVMGIHVMQNGELLMMDNQFIPNVANKVSTTQPTLTALQAIESAANILKYTPRANSIPLEMIEDKGGKAREAVYSKGGISQQDIPVKLMYYLVDDKLHLCWDMSIADNNSADWWSMRVDAQTGKILHKNNWTVYCDFGHDECAESDNHHHHANCTHHHAPKGIENAKNTSKSSMTAPDSYRVFPEPVESPIHGTRDLIVNPADPTASPFGWHDINGSPGAEYTITRGNNVWAQEDTNGNNGTGFSPDAGASLDFDYGLDLGLSPLNSPNLESGIVNLFYWSNLTHDVWYSYGFDEASGNFQQNNYGNGGAGADPVLADAFDGSGTNNANFSSPTDGSSGRMQMFQWTGASAGVLTANSPASVVGSYGTESAQFGSTSYNVTGDLVFVDDGSANPTEGCSAATNGAAINGNIAMVDRGTCEFGTKCLNAQNAGAIAVIVCNNVAGAPIAMATGADGASVTIPAVMISEADCVTLRAETPGANVTLISGSSQNRDGDLDNGIIAHEYGHGISIRLTGGANNSGCLSNSEQMGEGWSDYFGLMMTIKPTDTRNDIRPIGTFALGQSPTGSGIRTYPYTTDMSVNPHTYNDIGSEAIPHGVGSVWCAMLWEMTWDLIDQYGYDPDLINGTGGNNIAMALVIEGLKLQPCNPGFVDGRDAIIAADLAINGGANECTIKDAFARRGLGPNASQGGSGSTTDGSEDYSVSTCGPPTCDDGIRNGDETGVDCGGSNCPACPPENCAVYNFTGQVIDYDPGEADFGTATVQDGGATLYVTDNGWKAVPINYTVTPNTVLSFDFRSDTQGEIHEISFDNDLAFAPTHRIVIYGNQGYSGTFTNPVYSGSGNYESFAIPIGQTFSGVWQYLILISDDDANAAGDSYFRNIQIFEDYDNDLTCTNTNPPTCTDGIQNGDETGIDCGGATCPACTPGCTNTNAHNYDANAQVDDGSCETCTDGILNGDETDIDCGGVLCDACPTCTDGIQNGDETGIDCGGVNCPACPAEDCPLYDFTGQVVGYDVGGNDNGTATVQDGGATVYITGNGWKAVPINYNVTANTVLEFDFRSDFEGEIHEISFDTDLAFAPNQRIYLYGTQVTTNQYSGSGNYEHFTYAIGQFFTGTFTYLVLTCDDDANADGDSYFSNIQIYEDENNNLMCDDAPACAINENYTGSVLTGVYQVGNTISSSGVVGTGEEVEFLGNCIELNADFEVELGGEFLADIVPCTPLAQNGNSLQEDGIIYYTQDIKSENLNLEFESETAGQFQVKLQAINGKINHDVLDVSLNRPGKHHYQIDISTLSKGTYLMISKLNGREYVQKIVL